MFDWVRRFARKGLVTIDGQSVPDGRVGGGRSFAGIPITPARALALATVFACIRVRGETFAQISPKVYENLGDKRVERPDHWLAQRLRESPGAGYTPFSFAEKISNDMDTQGDFFAYRIWAGDEVREYVPLRPTQVDVRRTANGLAREYRVSGLDVQGKGEWLPARDILHIPRMLDADGLRGVTPLEQCRGTVGLSLAIERHGETVFKNGAAPSGVLEVPHDLSEQRMDDLQQRLDEEYSGELANRVLVLEDGAKLTPYDLKLRDQEFLAQRKFQRTELCGVYRVPPHMVGDLERTTFNNAEQQSLQFVVYGVQPDVKRVESVFNATELAGTPYYLEFNLDSLIRGDFETRMKGYRLGISSGLMTPNEARAKENVPGIGPDGDVLLMMSNVTSLERAIKGDTSTSGGGEPDIDPMVEGPEADDAA